MTVATYTTWSLVIDGRCSGRCRWCTNMYARNPADFVTSIHLARTDQPGISVEIAFQSKLWCEGQEVCGFDLFESIQFSMTSTHQLQKPNFLRKLTSSFKNNSHWINLDLVKHPCLNKFIHNKNENKKNFFLKKETGKLITSQLERHHN
jgi:hypothetical protein